jgi:hypothetical protein
MASKNPLLGALFPEIRAPNLLQKFDLSCGVVPEMQYSSSHLQPAIGGLHFFCPPSRPGVYRHDDAGPVSVPTRRATPRQYQERFAYQTTMVPEFAVQSMGVTMDPRSGQDQALFFAAPSVLPICVSARLRSDSLLQHSECAFSRVALIGLLNLGLPEGHEPVGEVQSRNRSRRSVVVCSCRTV